LQLIAHDDWGRRRDAFAFVRQQALSATASCRGQLPRPLQAPETTARCGRGAGRPSGTALRQPKSTSARAARALSNPNAPICQELQTTVNAFDLPPHSSERPFLAHSSRTRTDQERQQRVESGRPVADPVWYQVSDSIHKIRRLLGGPQFGRTYRNLAAWTREPRNRPHRISSARVTSLRRSHYRWAIQFTQLEFAILFTALRGCLKLSRQLFAKAGR